MHEKQEDPSSAGQPMLDGNLLSSAWTVATAKSRVRLLRAETFLGS